MPQTSLASIPSGEASSWVQPILAFADLLNLGPQWPQTFLRGSSHYMKNPESGSKSHALQPGPGATNSVQTSMPTPHFLKGFRDSHKYNGMKQAFGLPDRAGLSHHFFSGEAGWLRDTSHGVHAHQGSPAPAGANADMPEPLTHRHHMCRCK